MLDRDGRYQCKALPGCSNKRSREDCGSFLNPTFRRVNAEAATLEAADGTAACIEAPAFNGSRLIERNKRAERVRCEL